MSSKTITREEYETLPVVWAVDTVLGRPIITEARLVVQTDKFVIVAEPYHCLWEGPRDLFRVNRELLSDTFQVFESKQEAAIWSATYLRKRSAECRAQSDVCLQRAAEYDKRAQELEDGHE